MAKDYYSTLGINKTASASEVKAAFRKLAHKHHPDKGGGDEKKFKEINEAYQVLKDDKKRQQYDQFGQTFEQARSQGNAGAGGFSDFASNFGGNSQGFSFNGEDLGDLFGDLFGFGGRQSRGGRSRVGSDLQVDLTIDFEQAVFGTETSISLNKDEACSRCSGQGIEPGSSMATCSECKGTGQVVRTVGFGIGFSSVCPSCGGSGQRPEKKCQTCHGTGTEKKQKTIKIKIPAGIDNGQMIRLSGEGQTVQGGRAGDLYVKISVRSSNKFVRSGYDILTKIEISFSQAALGDKIEIDTLNGKVRLKIPEGTQSGRSFNIKGRGVPKLHSKARGDQIVKVIVKTPINLSRNQKKLLQELDSQS